MNHNIKFVTPSSIYSFNLETIMDGLPDTLDLFQFSQSPKYLFLGLFEFNSSLILSISSSSFPISISNSTDLYRSLKSLSWFLNTSFNLFWVSLFRFYNLLVCLSASSWYRFRKSDRICISSSAVFNLLVISSGGETIKWILPKGLGSINLSHEFICQ